MLLVDYTDCGVKHSEWKGLRKRVAINSPKRRRKVIECKDPRMKKIILKPKYNAFIMLLCNSYTYA